MIVEAEQGPTPIERIAALEADAQVHRAYIRALISLIPSDRVQLGAISGATKQINEAAQKLPPDQGKALTEALQRLDANGVHRIWQG